MSAKGLARLTVTFVVSAIAVGFVVVGSRQRRQVFVGSSLANQTAPTLDLPDDAGAAFNLAKQRGNLILVYFGYMNCPNVCPSTLANLQAVINRMAADAARVRVVFVTLDPARDTNVALRDYLASFKPINGRSFIGLVGGKAAVADAARQWGVTWRPADDGRFIDHTSVVTAVGPDGRMRLRYGYGQIGDVPAVARDLEALLHGA